MIFGQGAVRCHPFIQSEMNALNETNPAKALRQFDAILWRHVRFFLNNLARVSGWPGRCEAGANTRRSKHETLLRQLLRLSTGFALTADFALLTLGGQLKRKERISGRFADVLSHLYLCSCALKHFENQVRKRTTAASALGLSVQPVPRPAIPVGSVPAAAIPYTGSIIASRAVSVGQTLCAAARRLVGQLRNCFCTIIQPATA